MRFIPTRVHGIIDYLFGVLLIAAPWLFGFADLEMARWVPIIIGALIIIYSLLTRYEMGVADVIPMNVHLWLDILGGLVLAASPWLFGFADEIWWPHLTFGLLEIIIAVVTETTPAVHRTVRRTDLTT